MPAAPVIRIFGPTSEFCFVITLSCSSGGEHRHVKRGRGAPNLTRESPAALERG
jgi:hypothetical protein